MARAKKNVNSEQRHPNRMSKGKRNKETVACAKQEKKQESSRMDIKAEKFQDKSTRSITPLTAKNENQKIALGMFNEKQLIGLFGSSGVGKTEIAVWYACSRWLKGEIDNIIITRPYQHLGADYGATKGNDAEKLLPFCMSMLMKMKRYLGVGIMRSNFKIDAFDEIFAEADGIQIVPVEKIQGMSFNERTIIIGDEIQNTSVAQIKALTTRAEEGCQIILCGDDKQTALKGKNGLTYLCEKLEQYPHELAGVVRFSPEDCCRTGITAHLTAVFEKDGNW